MQTQFGCCIIDGEVVKSKSEKLKIKKKKTETDKKYKKQKKVIHQSEVEFE